MGFDINLGNCHHLGLYSLTNTSVGALYQKVIIFVRNFLKGAVRNTISNLIVSGNSHIHTWLPLIVASLTRTSVELLSTIKVSSPNLMSVSLTCLKMSSTTRGHALQ